MAAAKTTQRLALERALIEIPEQVRLSDYVLSGMFGIGPRSVGRVRARLESHGLIYGASRRLCRDGGEKDVSRIGRRWVDSGSFAETLRRAG
jgi:hypothetical protein